MERAGSRELSRSLTGSFFTWQNCPTVAFLIHEIQWTVRNATDTHSTTTVCGYSETLTPTPERRPARAQIHASHHNLRVSELDRRSRNGAATAVFCVRTALDHSGHGISLESVLYPEHYVVHASGQHVEINAGDACGCFPGSFPLAASLVVEQISNDDLVPVAAEPRRDGKAQPARTARDDTYWEGGRPCR